jgi:hypothetical protein
VLNGTIGNKTVLGAGFCGRVVEELKKANLTGLQETLAAVPTDSCSKYVGSTEVTGDATRRRGFTMFDHGVFVSGSIVIAILSYAAFL